MSSPDQKCQANYSINYSINTLAITRLELAGVADILIRTATRNDISKSWFDPHTYPDFTSQITSPIWSESAKPVLSAKVERQHYIIICWKSEFVQINEWSSWLPTCFFLYALLSNYDTRCNESKPFTCLRNIRPANQLNEKQHQIPLTFSYGIRLELPWRYRVCNMAMKICIYEYKQG